MQRSVRLVKSSLNHRSVRRIGALFVAAALVAALSATQTSCRLYRITVQQGNVITQDMVDGLKPGMTREQVAYVMGEPVVRNPFNDDQWDYVYTLEVPGRTEQQRKLSLFFNDGVLSHLTGDLKPSAENEGGGDAGGDATNP